MATFLTLLLARLQFLAIALVVGSLVGELPAAVLDPLAVRAHRFASRLRGKLDRIQRGPGTLIYRGMVATLFLLVPALAIGVLLAQDGILARALCFLFLVALFGRALRSWATLRIARRAARGNLTLETGDELFADTHGVLRHTILARGEAFAVTMVGAGFWFLLAGPIGMFAYLGLSLATLHFSEGIFGWSARGLFLVLNVPPRALTCLSLVLGALFVPRCHPVRALKQRRYYGFIAELLGLSLGGPDRTPAGQRQLPWAGNGTAKATAQDLTRFLLLRTVASLLLLLFVAAPTFIKDIF